MDNNGFDFGQVVYIGPSFDGRGGIATVATVYRRVISPFRYVRINSSRGGLLRNLLAAFGAFARIAWLRCRGGRILHVHYASGKSWKRETVFAAWGRLLGYRTVMHCHSNFAKIINENGAGQVARRLGRASVNIVLAESYRDMAVRDLGLKNTVVVPNFIGTRDDIAPFADSGNPVPVFVYLGLLSKSKGFFDLLRACGRLRRSGRQFRLIACGIGDENAVRAVVAEENLSDVIEMPGWIVGDDKVRVLSRADVLVLPSYSEGMPMSVIEAMQAGCAVVGTAVGAVPGMVDDGVSGYVVTPGDVDALTERMSALIDDPERLKAFQRASYAKGSSYVAEEIVPQLAGIYKNRI